LSLLVRGERRELRGAREQLLRLSLQLLQAFDVLLLLVFLERDQCAIDEVEDARFAGASVKKASLIG
jgi:hypothetical protein